MLPTPSTANPSSDLDAAASPSISREHIWCTASGCGGRTVAIDARDHLRIAYKMLHGFGAEAFAERARRELIATGESVRQRTIEASEVLTAQEAQIARLAGEGKTNSEIGAAAVPQSPYGRMAPAQGVHEARRRLA